MKTRQLILLAERAEQRLAAANDAAVKAKHSIAADLRQSSPWTVPLAAVVTGLILAQAPRAWRHRVLARGLPLIGGGLFALINPLLRRMQ